MSSALLKTREGWRALHGNVRGPSTRLFGFRPDGSPEFMVLPSALLTVWIASAIPAVSTLLIPIVCALILLIGMPHGMFDFLTLSKLSGGRRLRLVAALLAYVGVAGAVWLLWQHAPMFALAAFIAIAICHFSEDWIGEQSRLGAAAMPVSILALPALLYPSELSAIFTLIGGDSAGVMADYLKLLAPALGLVAIAHVLIDATGDSAHRAWRNAFLLLAALILPPGIGFAIYFCLYHSPIHFVEGRKELMDRQHSPRNFFILMSLASIVVLLWVILFQPFKAWDSALIAATFQTLSILTVPHMLLPFFAARLIRSRRA